MSVKTFIFERMRMTYTSKNNPITHRAVLLSVPIGDDTLERLGYAELVLKSDYDEVNEKLEKAVNLASNLEGWAKHTNACEVNRHFNIKPCSCGLYELRKVLAEIKGE